MYEKKIGLKMSKLREQQGLTSTVLAERVGISQAQISRLENGKQGFRSSTLARISEALGVTPAYFFLEEGEDPRQALGAPGRLGEALQHPEFRGVMEKAAGLYLEKRDRFGKVVSAVKSAAAHTPSGG